MLSQLTVALIAIIFCFLCLTCVVTTVSIANDSQLNDKYCGMNRLSRGMPFDCFKWHKDMIPGLKNSRDATPGEIPWFLYMVLIEKAPRLTKKYCTGALVSHNRFVLTSASCVSENIDTNDTYIYGHLDGDIDLHEDDRRNIHIHPDYKTGFDNSDDQTWKPYDIALIKLTTPPKLKNDLTGNTVCLPDNTSSVDLDQYVMTAGMGREGSRRRIGSIASIGPKLIVSNRLVEHTTDPNLKQLYGNTTFALKSIRNDHLVCEADIGAPVWRYHRGRAVVIGVIFDTIPKLGRRACEENADSVVMATSVAPLMDWIASVVNNN